MNLFWPDHGRKVLWCLIPKVGSTSMRMALSAGPKVSRDEAREWNHYYTVAFVRHPWDRVISALFSVLRDLGPFGDRVEKWILSPPRELMDVHVRPQADILRGIRVDFLGCYESLERDWSYLQQKIDVPELGHYHKGEHRPAVIDYDWQRVEHIYREDFELCPGWR